MISVLVETFLTAHSLLFLSGFLVLSGLAVIAVAIRRDVLAAYVAQSLLSGVVFGLLIGLIFWLGVVKSPILPDLPARTQGLLFSVEGAIWATVSAFLILGRIGGSAGSELAPATTARIGFLVGALAALTIMALHAVLAFFEVLLSPLSDNPFRYLAVVFVIFVYGILGVPFGGIAMTIYARFLARLNLPRPFGTDNKALTVIAGCVLVLVAIIPISISSR